MVRHYSEKAVDVVDSVIRFLHNNKEEAIHRLFPGEDKEAYRKEWMERDVARFWFHLDLQGRRQLMSMAVEHYDW